VFVKGSTGWRWLRNGLLLYGVYVYQARLVATWEVLDDCTWKVQFVNIVVSILGVQLFTQKFNNVFRIWDMPYLDNDLR